MSDLNKQEQQERSDNRRGENIVEAERILGAPLTERERKEFASYTAGSIVGIKLIRSLSTEALKKALSDEVSGETLRLQVGKDTNPSWVVSIIAETLYMRHELDEIKFDYIMEYGELGKVEIL
jgi:hypothetical protein